MLRVDPKAIQTQWIPWAEGPNFGDPPCPNGLILSYPLRSQKMGLSVVAAEATLHWQSHCKPSTRMGCTQGLSKTATSMPALGCSLRLAPYFFRVIFVGNVIPGCWLVDALEFSFLPIGSVLSDPMVTTVFSVQVYLSALPERGSTRGLRRGSSTYYIVVVVCRVHEFIDGLI